MFYYLWQANQGSIINTILQFLGPMGIITTWPWLQSPATILFACHLPFDSFLQRIFTLGNVASRLSDCNYYYWLTRMITWLHKIQKTCFDMNVSPVYTSEFSFAKTLTYSSHGYFLCLETCSLDPFCLSIMRTANLLKHSPVS